MTDSSADIDALIDAAREEPDEDSRWELLVAATTAGPAAVRERVERLFSSDSTIELALGADLVSAMPSLTGGQAAELRAKGFSIPDTLPFADDDRAAVAARLRGVLLASSSPDVIEKCVVAAGKLERPELLDVVLRHVEAADDDVREACAYTLSIIEPEGPSPRAIAALVRLAGDSVGSVRDWAIAGLGSLQGMPVDTPETRRLFRAHTDDSDENAREEAIRALALLGDVEMLVLALGHDDVSSDLVTRATGIGDHRLHRPLLELQTRGWAHSEDPDVAEQYDELLSRAIRATAPSETQS